MKNLTWRKLNTEGKFFSFLKLRVVIEEEELDSFIHNLCYYNIMNATEREKEIIFEEFKEKNKEFFKEKEEIFSVCHRQYGVGNSYCYFITVDHLFHILESVVIPCEE